MNSEQGPALRPREQQLLEYFQAHPGRIISRKELSENVWGFSMDPRSRVIDQTVAVLRQKLRSGRILTRSGHGYEYESEPCQGLRD